MKRRLRICALALAFALALCLSAAAEERAPVLGEFSAVDIYGEPIDQAELEKQPLTMLNIWGTFCGPCLDEMPDLARLSADYAEKGVQLIGLVSDANGPEDEDTLALAREIAEQTGASYRHIVPGEDLYGLLAQITAVPTTVFLDGEGRQVGYAYVGSRSYEEWAAILDETLAELPQP